MTYLAVTRRIADDDAFGGNQILGCLVATRSCSGFLVGPRHSTGPRGSFSPEYLFLIDDAIVVAGWDEERGTDLWRLEDESNMP